VTESCTIYSSHSRQPVETFGYTFIWQQQPLKWLKNWNSVFFNIQHTVQIFFPHVITIFFGLFKDTLSGLWFVNDDEVKDAKHTWFCVQPKTFFADGIRKPADHSDKCAEARELRQKVPVYLFLCTSYRIKKIINVPYFWIPLIKENNTNTVSIVNSQNMVYIKYT